MAGPEDRRERGENTDNRHRMTAPSSRSQCRNPPRLGCQRKGPTGVNFRETREAGPGHWPDPRPLGTRNRYRAAASASGDQGSDHHADGHQHQARVVDAAGDAGGGEGDLSAGDRARAAVAAELRAPDGPVPDSAETDEDRESHNEKYRDDSAGGAVHRGGVRRR